MLYFYKLLLLLGGVAMTLCLASSSHPVRDRWLAHADRLSDLRRRQPNGVRLDGQLNPSRCTLAKKRLGLSELVEELLSASLVGNGLPRLAGPSWRRRHDHRCVPICETSVGTALAQPVGTWKDPTRISLGPRFHGVNLRGMVCDRQVAPSMVNEDRCSPCSQVIVLSTLRSPTVRTVECTQCCHFSTSTRRNRQVPVGESPMPSRRARVQPGVKPDRRTASLNPTMTRADAENARGEH